MQESLEQLKHIERLSRQTRHHRIYLNQIYEQKLRRELDHITDEYEQTFLRSKSHLKLERQRKQALDITIQQIARERKGHVLPTKIERKPIQSFPKDDGNLQNRPSYPMKLPSAGSSCRLFSHKCQLYPCQPVYHYTSFIKKEHDQTVRQRNSTPKNSDLNSSSSHFQNLCGKIQEKKYQQNRRQLAVTLRNQYHLANRHVFMERTMERLDEQSRLLHERLADKKNFDYGKERQHELKEAIQRHLEYSAKFCL